MANISFRLQIADLYTSFMFFKPTNRYANYARIDYYGWLETRTIKEMMDIDISCSHGIYLVAQIAECPKINLKVKAQWDKLIMGFNEYHIF